MPTYRYLGVDHSLTAVAARFGTTLEALWNLNDAGHHHHRAEDWARSVGYTETIQVPTSEWTARWEWDYFDLDEGEIGLTEFRTRRNNERAERRRQGRPVGPELTEEMLWLALPNEDFRFQHIMREAHARGATSRDVQNLEDNPSAVTVRPSQNLGLFVPMVPVPRRRAAAAVPNGTARVLVTIPHWIRQLREMREDIEHASDQVHALEARERAVRAEFTEALTTFSRMDEFLRILIEGRSGASEPHTYAAASASVLQGLDPLRRQLFHIQQRVADLGRRRREAVVPPALKERRSNRLRDMVRDRTFSALYRRAVVEDAHAYGERVAPQVQETLLNAHRRSIEANLQWAHDDIAAALDSSQPAWRTVAQQIPVATALFVPMFGNLAGPPSVAVWLAQWRATRTLSRAVSNVGHTLNAEIHDEVERLVTRYVQGRRIVITAAQYEQWVSRVQFSQSMYHAVLEAPPGVTGVNLGATNSIQVAPAVANAEEQMFQMEHFLSTQEWVSTTRRLGAEANSVAHELNDAERAAGAATSGLRRRIIDTIFNASMSAEDRRTALRRLAEGELTGSVQTGNLATSGLLVLNVLAIVAGVINFTGSTEHTTLQTVELTMNMIGGTYTAALAVIQLLANRSEVNWAATFLETNNRLLGSVAGALALLQAMASLLSTIDTYGTSRPLALAGNVMSVASGALLWVGWAATLDGLAVGATLSAIGLSLGLGAAVVGIVLVFRDEDAKTKTFFVQFVQNFGRSAMIRQLELWLSDSPDGGTIFSLELRDVRLAAQRLTFPLAVWEERPALEAIGFSYTESGELTEARPSHQVGAIDRDAAGRTFVQQVNANFTPVR